jgi:hypothetical protein
MLRAVWLWALVCSACAPLWAQDAATDSTQAAGKRPHWSDNIQVRGYVQLRYNRLLETNPDLICEQCDRSWGGDGGFSLRRVRVIFFGQVSKRVYFYIQPDFASVVGSSQNVGQLRDAYFDVGLNADNTWRVRMGQSKVPFGYENMQSSQNRLPLDRADALNSAFTNERDMGVFIYWAPTRARERYSMLVRSGLKGSGDYGVLALGAFNGQGPNRADLNREVHTVARLSYPFLLGKRQIIEPGVMAYTGRYVVSQVSKGVSTQPAYDDQRLGVTLNIAPQPIGLLAEYNWGTGPQYDAATRSVQQRDLHGGYATLTARLPWRDMWVLPYVRGQYYAGGKKHELDARLHEVRELELGVEWQPFPTFELVVAHVWSSRRFEDDTQPTNLQEGSLLRLHGQLNF